MTLMTYLISPDCTDSVGSFTANAPAFGLFQFTHQLLCIKHSARDRKAAQLEQHKSQAESSVAPGGL